MAEDVTRTVTTLSLNPEALKDLFIFRADAIDAFVSQYSQLFDRNFAKIAETVAKDEEKLKKFREIRDKHLNEYKKYIESRLDKEMNEMFANPEIQTKLAYISDNYNSIPADLIRVWTALQPFKDEFSNNLKTLELSVDQRLQEKSETLKQLEEELKQTSDSYESLRTLVAKKALSIVKDIDSIEVNDLESLPKDLIK